MGIGMLVDKAPKQAQHCQRQHTDAERLMKLAVEVPLWRVHALL